MPDHYALEQNYPNPFNPMTTIRFSIPEVRSQRSDVGRAALKVYDVLGREVAMLVNEEKMPGTYDVTFNAGDLASGVYIYRMTTGEFTATRRMVLMK